MKNLIILLAILPATGFSAISLRFSDTVNSLTGLSTSTGNAGVNGLAWGIVIDTSGDNFTSALAASVGLTLEDEADFGNGYIFFYGSTTVNQLASAETGSGAVIVSNSMNVYGTSGIAQGQQFAVMWFDAGLNQGDPLVAGDNYGLVQNGGFLLPPDNSNNFSYAALSAGEDPIRQADLELVPEPSAILLLGLGTLGLLRRRR